MFKKDFKESTNYNAIIKFSNYFQQNIMLLLNVLNYFNQFQKIINVTIKYLNKLDYTL